MRTKHLCVLIYIRIKGEVGAVKYVEILQYFFTDRPKAVLLLSNLFVIYVSHLSIILLSRLFLKALC